MHTSHFQYDFNIVFECPLENSWTLNVIKLYTWFDLEEFKA